MNIKIKEPVLEEVIIKCYEEILGKALDRKEMYVSVIPVVKNFLENKGYKILSVKCDNENNPSDVVDIERIYVDIFEEDIPGSSNYIKHRIVL